MKPTCASVMLLSCTLRLLRCAASGARSGTQLHERPGYCRQARATRPIMPMPINPRAVRHRCRACV